MKPFTVLLLVFMGVIGIFGYFQIAHKDHEEIFEKQVLSYRDLLGAWQIEENNASGGSIINIYSNNNSDLVGETLATKGDLQELGVGEHVSKWQNFKIYTDYVQFEDILAIKDNQKATKTVFAKLKKNNTVLEIYDAKNGQLLYTCNKI